MFAFFKGSNPTERLPQAVHRKFMEFPLQG